MDPFAEPAPRSKRPWIIGGGVIVGILLAVILFRVVMRSGKTAVGPSASTAASSPCGCAWPGTACVGPVCELAPSASWTLSPMRVSFPAAPAASGAPAPASSVVVCSRPTGGRDWKCTKPARAVSATPSASVQHADFPPELAADGDVVVTTEALKGTGIDVEVRRADAAIASATALHHKILRPGPTLFQGGVRFGAKDKGLSDVLYRIKATE